MTPRFTVSMVVRFVAKQTKIRVKFYPGSILHFKYEIVCDNIAATVVFIFQSCRSLRDCLSIRSGVYVFPERLHLFGSVVAKFRECHQNSPEDAHCFRSSP